MTFATAEEAFYDALRHAEAGAEYDFVIHQGHCLAGDEEVELCICTPQVVHHGHEAADCEDGD